MAKTETDEKDEGTSLILKNKKAFHNYEVIQHLECGLMLQGTEVKSLRAKNVAFADCFATVRDGELVLIGLNISEYAMGNRQNHTPDRSRKLLARKAQIRKLRGALEQQGLTLVPLALYWRRGLAKVDLGLVRGKKQFDKRDSIKDREQKREKQRILRQHGR